MTSSGEAVPELTHILRVDRPLEDLAELLGHRPADWLASFGSIAVHAGEAAAGRGNAPASRGPRRVKTVSVELGDLPPDDDFARVDAAIIWRTSGFRWAFPSFDGRITAVGETSSSCIVTLEGSYELPAAASTEAGREAASVAAETAAATLLRTVRDAVEEQVRSGA